mgnify:CR=1 FL=1
MQDKHRYKSLLKNIGMMTISQFSTKILTFFLVPLYTSILTTDEYGIYDLYNTTVQLVVPVLTLNIMEAVLRFALEQKENEEVLIFGIEISIVGSGIFGILIALNNRFLFLPDLAQFSKILFWMFVSTVFYQTLSNYARGKEDVHAVAVAGVVSSGVMIALNIILLVVVKIGLKGYFMSYILGSIISSLYLSIRIKLWNVKVRKVNKELKAAMLSFSIPMILNSVGWWINNASDRYIVIWFCGMAVNGIYSVGYKIPSILSVFQSIFNQAWVLSSVRAYEDNSDKKFFENTYKIYNALMLFVCSGIILTARVTASILYSKDFYNAWIYVPFLTISILFGAMSGYIGGIFSAVKDTRAYSFTTIIGAVTNIFLNILFVKKLGAIGAALATLISYYLIWQLRMIWVKKYITLEVNIARDYVAYTLLIMQSFILLGIPKGCVAYLLNSAILLILLVLYRLEIRYFLSRLFFKDKKKSN